MGECEEDISGKETLDKNNGGEGRNKNVRQKTIIMTQLMKSKKKASEENGKEQLRESKEKP